MNINERIARLADEIMSFDHCKNRENFVRIYKNAVSRIGDVVPDDCMAALVMLETALKTNIEMKRDLNSLEREREELQRKREELQRKLR